MNNKKELSTKTSSSQNCLLMMALASSLSMTTSPTRAHEGQTMSMIEQTYDYSATYVQETRYVSPKKKNFRKRYARMAKSDWFKRAYDNKSIGDVIDVDY